MQGCPLNLKYCPGYQHDLKEYKKSKEYRVRAGKRNQKISDMVVHVNLVHSEIPVLKKFACRDYYKVINDFENFCK